MLNEFTPLKACIKYWPGFLGNASFIDYIGLSNFESIINDQELSLSGNAVILETIEFPFLLIPKSKISILKDGDYTEIPFSANVSPVFNLTIPSIVVNLTLDYDFLVPVVLQGSTWIRKVDSNGNPIPFSMELSGYGISLDMEKGIDFVPNSPSITIDSIQIGETGIIASFNDVIPIFNDENIVNIPIELPANFKGVYIGEADIILPKKWFSEASTNDIPSELPAPTNLSLKGRNMLIGSGGFSGKISIEGSGYLYKKIGSFLIGLESFSLEFQQNAIKECEIGGKLIIPGFKNDSGQTLMVDVDVLLGHDGELAITASTNYEIPVFKLENAFKLYVKELSFHKQSDASGGHFYVAVKGGIDFTVQNQIGSYLPDKLDVKMLIYDDGRFEFEGGAIVFPKTYEFKIGPVKIGVSAIHMGTYEKDNRKYKFFGFDGGVSVNPGGVDARGKGVKLYFTTDDGDFEWFIKLESLAVDIIIPASAKPKDAAVIIKGFLSIKDPVIPAGTTEPMLSVLKNSTEYAGSIYVSIPKLRGIEASAAMRLNPSVPSFIVDLGIEISTPILLGSTGLGIYGFRALFGKKYVATKESAGVPEDGEWWQYYKAKIDPDYKEGIQLSKFSIKNGFSFGAGVSLATSYDAGKTFSSKLFFMLSLPDVFLFQGQANILKERISLDTVPDPPFFALIAITSQSIEAGFGVNYRLPDSGNIGKILTVDGVIEMGFFFGNSSAWYFNIGRDLPENRRIQARVFDLFNMYSYLMLSSAGIRAGAGVSIGFPKKTFGPLSAELKAYLDTSGRISYHPKQIGGAIQIGGSVSLKVCGFGFSVSGDASLAAEAPKPYMVTGEFKVCVEVIKKKFCAHFEFTWEFTNDKDLSEVPLLASSTEDAKKVACATNIATGEIFPIAALQLSNPNTAIPKPTESSNWIGAITDDKYTIPLDSYIDIDFKKGLNVNGTSGNLNKLGGISSSCECIEFVPPQKGKSSRVRHTYKLEGIDIQYFDEVSDSWKQYDFYNALLPMFPNTAGTVGSLIDSTVLSGMKWGYWQQQKPKYNNKLRILATTPLSYAAKMGSNSLVIEDLGINANTIFCAGNPIPMTCVLFDDNTINHVYSYNKLHHYKSILFRLTKHDGIVLNRIYREISNGLYIEPNDTLEIFFNEPMKNVDILLNSAANEIKVSIYRKMFTTPINQFVLPIYNYELIEERTLESGDFDYLIEFTSSEGEIEYIKIEAGVSDSPEIHCIQLNTDAVTLNQMKAFVNQLIKNTHFLSKDDVVLNPGKNSTLYNGYFMGTNLYPVNNWSTYEIILNHKFISDTTLIFVIYDSQSFYCKYSFELINNSKNYSINNIVDIISISAYSDCNTSGINNTFIMRAKLNHDEVVELLGKFCNVVSDSFCYDANSTFLYKVCYLSMKDYLSNLTIPDSSSQIANNQTLLNSINKTLQPIWRPNTAYAIKITTTDNLKVENDSTKQSYSNTTVFGFRTSGPVGHFHKFPVSLTSQENRSDYDPLESKAREEEYKLKSLKHYIDYEKSYPNADGDLINSKPLFYQNAQLKLFYLYNYVYEFYNDWVDYENTGSSNPALLIAKSNLEILIKDPADVTKADENPITKFKGNNISHVNSTNNLSAPPANINSINQDIIILNNMLANNSTPCVTSYGQLTPIDIASIRNANLQPLKLYTAQFIANYNPKIGSGFKAEDWKSVVHSYVFQTSRYSNFTEQVNSYILKVDEDNVIVKDAVYTINAKKVGTPTPIVDLALAERVIKGLMNNSDKLLVQQYADQFDRLLNGVFHLDSNELHAAVTTEFNFIKHPDTHKILGILVRNPEPFNDPKLPKADPNISSAEPLETLEVSKYNGTSYGNSSEFYVIHSKDRTGILITNRSFDFDIDKESKLKFSFKYKLFNGIDYEDESLVNVEIDLNNYSF